MADDVAFYDVETKSRLNLKLVGQYRYAADPSTELLCVGWAINDDPIRIWQPGQPAPKDFIHHIKRQRRVVAFNAPFERQIHAKILGPRHGWAIPRLEQYRCLMAMGNALALPGSLDGLATAMSVEGGGKDKVGRRVMLQMTKPRRARKGEDEEEVHWYDDEVRTDQLHEYCVKDVSDTRDLFSLLWPLIDEEQAIWEMDQRINDRGFHVDNELLLAMRRITLDAGADIDKQIKQKTGGTVQTVGQVDAIKRWLFDVWKIRVTSLDKNIIAELIANKHIPKQAREVLDLRLGGAQAAVKKVDAFLSRRESDGRIRGAYVYHAAGTGRFTSRGIQVHNLKRLTTEDQDEIKTAVDDLMTGDYKILKTKYAHARPLQIVGDNIRTAIDAAPGHVLIGADFSGIEARVTAWLAGETRKLQVFRDYDAGKGPDPYVAAAANIFNLSLEEIMGVKINDPANFKNMRQGGKGAELAFGFQGGVNAYRKFMPEAMLAAPEEEEKIDKEREEIARLDRDAQLKRRGVGGGRAANEVQAAKVKFKPSLVGKFTTNMIEDIKTKWRKAHPNIENYWHALNHASKQIAIKAARGDWNIEPRQVKTLTFEFNNKFMFIVLPSGRRISYPFIGRTMRYRDQFFIKKPEDKQEGYLDTFFMDNSPSWHRVFLYGGIICENVVQAVARDLLVYAMTLVEKAGLPIVCHIHDEAVIEVPIKHAEKAMALFSKLMMTLPPWARASTRENIPELPLVAKSWQASRYVK